MVIFNRGSISTVADMLGKPLKINGSNEKYFTDIYSEFINDNRATAS